MDLGDVVNKTMCKMKRSAATFCGAVMLLAGQGALPARAADSANYAKVATVTTVQTLDTRGYATASQQYLVGFPHIAFGYWDVDGQRGHWQTNYLLWNTSAVPAKVTLRHFADNGQPLPVSVEGKRDVMHEYMIPANSPRNIAIDGTVDPLNWGWTAVVYDNAGVRGQGIFLLHNPDGTESQAIVPMTSFLNKTYLLLPPTGSTTMPFDNINGDTGVAYMNTTGAPLDLQVDVLSQGVRVGEITTTLPAYGHVAYTLPKTHSFTEGRDGILVLKTPGVGTVGFRFNMQGNKPFTSLDAQ